MPKKTDGETMHERILHSALEIFSNKGYSAATIKDISNRAGCNTVTIFRHFEDKKAVMSKSVDMMVELILLQVREPAIGQ